MSGMKPPMSRPRSALIAKNPALLDRKACEPAVMDHPTINIGIHLSAPSFLLMSPLGSSAARKEARKIVWPSRRRGKVSILERERARYLSRKAKVYS